VKISYLNKREGEKRFRGVICGQKLTLNHPSMVNEEEKIRILADGTQKRDGERSGINCYFFFKTMSIVT